jgi:hypothetical protein
MGIRSEKVWGWILDISVMLLVSSLILFVVLEWAVGCGETYVDANGVTHKYECLFINR